MLAYFYLMNKSIPASYWMNRSHLKCQRDILISMFLIRLQFRFGGFSLFWSWRNLVILRVQTLLSHIFRDVGINALLAFQVFTPCNLGYAVSSFRYVIESVQIHYQFSFRIIGSNSNAWHSCWRGRWNSVANIFNNLHLNFTN